jgi:hypothetical protein
VSFILWFTVENYVVIIAASIPALRPLLLHVKKQVSSVGNSYSMNHYGNNNNRTKGYMHHGEGHDGTLKSYNRAAVAAGTRSLEPNTTKLPDSESEEHILPIQSPNGAGITKTTDVTVRYHEMDTSELERNRERTSPTQGY